MLLYVMGYSILCRLDLHYLYYWIIKYNIVCDELIMIYIGDKIFDHRNTGYSLFRHIIKYNI